MSRLPWLAVQHLSFETPALIGEEMVSRGIDFEIARMDLGHSLPGVSTLGGLIIMGGPMGVGDVHEHPHLAEEIELIGETTELGLPVLGVCLGAQLLAAALGAPVYRCPTEEIGPGTVDLVVDDPVLGNAGETLPVLHWHGDTFDLPTGADLLASSSACENQAFRCGDRAYGLQFHVEIGATAAAAIEPHLPAGVSFDDDDRKRVEQAGKPVISRFFDVVND